MNRSIFQIWWSNITKNIKNTKTVNINFYKKCTFKSNVLLKPYDSKYTITLFDITIENKKGRGTVSFGIQPTPFSFGSLEEIPFGENLDCKNEKSLYFASGCIFKLHIATPLKNGFDASHTLNKKYLEVEFFVDKNYDIGNIPKELIISNGIPSTESTILLYAELSQNIINVVYKD